MLFKVQVSLNYAVIPQKNCKGSSNLKEVGGSEVIYCVGCWTLEILNIDLKEGMQTLL